MKNKDNERIEKAVKALHDIESRLPKKMIISSEVLVEVLAVAIGKSYEFICGELHKALGEPNEEPDEKNAEAQVKVTGE